MVTPRLFENTVDFISAQKRCYDVVVVGAGPSGSATAYHLARQGADVLLVDRFSFPRDKACGDAVMPPALQELATMGLIEQMQEQYTQVKQIGSAFYGMPPSHAEISGTGDFSCGYVAPRYSFDALLCEHALQAGASWLDQVVIHSVTEKQGEYALVSGVRIGQPLRLKAHIIVAADGSGSRLARQLRQELLAEGDTAPLTLPEDQRTRYTALRGYYTEVKDLSEILEFYFRGEPGTHYYWVFPIHGGANIGVIASMEQLRAEHTDLQQALVQFIQSPELQSRMEHAYLRDKISAAPLAAGLRGTALYGDHLLCVGDAAALIHPLSAEGISGALVSGRLAAETALAALAQKDYSRSALSPYGEALRDRYQATYDQLLAWSGLVMPKQNT